MIGPQFIGRAGIRVVLNARTAVSAAANPVLGRFNDFHFVNDHVDFYTRILLRFNLTFMFRDIKNKECDCLTAEHILSLYKFKEDACIASHRPFEWK
jgi:DNA replication licensing factor MCM5